MPQNTYDSGQNGDYINIPMPNESESARPIWSQGKGHSGLSGIAGFIREHIRLEELILIGLIILLLGETIEDDFLLIILIYILLF